MTHPPRAHNPHVWTEFGNTVTHHIVEGAPAPVAAESLEEELWQTPTDPDGTDSSTSSGTAPTPSESPETSSPKPAPSAENPPEQDRTIPSAAPGDTGSGTARRKARTPRPGKSDDAE